MTVKDFEVGLDKRIEKVEALGLGEQDNVIGLMMYLGDPEDLVLVEHLLVKNKSKCLEMKENAEEVSPWTNNKSDLYSESSFVIPSITDFVM